MDDESIEARGAVFLRRRGKVAFHVVTVGEGGVFVEGGVFLEVGVFLLRG